MIPVSNKIKLSKKDKHFIEAYLFYSVSRETNYIPIFISFP